LSDTKTLEEKLIQRTAKLVDVHNQVSDLKSRLHESNNKLVETEYLLKKADIKVDQAIENFMVNQLEHLTNDQAIDQVAKYFGTEYKSVAVSIMNKFIKQSI
jgi:predicted  nucleic acid-binding Zn-ribbon protein